MSKNLNVSIPDSLFERMQPLRDRLNKSAICRDALLSAVEREELRDKGTVEEFIIQTRNDYMVKYEEEGRKLAIMAYNNKHLPYALLEHVARDIPCDTEVDGYHSLHDYFYRDLEECDLWSEYVDNFIADNDITQAGQDYLARGFAKEIVHIFDNL